MKENRPDPDKLLANIKSSSEKHGSLKIYLGMSAGVGKTFAMLSDAAIEKNRGRDVVAGYIEPHGRAETEGLCAQFEALPHLSIEYRGVKVAEFDLESALKRKPQIILVDELAHTNAPGLRHAKRWQDVLELVQAGIDVYTTLNVQHLESLNDVITSITGVEVKETVPDSIVKGADKIELIDIPPDELITRLKEGKIYPKDRVDAALKNFFQQGNLLALREITLRKAAEKIDAEMLTYRANTNVESVWKTNERILVAIAPNPFARKLVRAAARIALNRHAELIAVFVETPRYQFLSVQDRQLVEDAIMLAQALDASIERRSSTDIVEEILNVAVMRNVTLIVIGKPIRTRLGEMLIRSVADDLIRRSGAIDVQLVTGEEEDATSVPIVVRNEDPFVVPLLLTTAIVGVATAISIFLSEYLDLTNLVMIYMLAIVTVALSFGRTEAILASIISVLAFDYLFVPPLYSFAIKHVQYLITFIVMLVTGLVVSTLGLRVRLQAKTVSERERRMQTLYELGKELVRATSTADVGKAVRKAVRSLCGGDACFLIPRGSRLVPSPSSTSQFEFDEGELAVAALVFEKRKSAGAFTDTLPGAQGFYLPVCIEDICYGVLGLSIEPKMFDRSFIPILVLMTQEAALCLQRNKMQNESFDAKLSSETHEARTMALNAISHDFRTPLTVIGGATDLLIEQEKGISPAGIDLLQDLKKQTNRLTSLVTKLVLFARLESKNPMLHLEWNSLKELVSAALKKMENALSSRNLIVEIPEDFPLLYIDAGLFEHLFIFLIENSVEHAPNATELRISASKDEEYVSISISDNGPGIPEEVKTDLSRLLLEGDVRGKAGSGLGLLICKAIVRRHGGEFTIQSTEGGAVCEISMAFSAPKL